jgi:hypothetical protein
MQFTFKIPSQTPSGQYLLRMDLIWATWSGAQCTWPTTDGFVVSVINRQLHLVYPTCAQISVTGSSTGDLPAGVKIPEIFSPDSPGAPSCSSVRLGPVAHSEMQE